ncbi:MAG: glycosyltransferase family 4 protein [Bacteroidales bacterium]|nr:glycosyltransferase family 4 protein [Candidatus Colimorpha pelethequi]
MRIAINTRLLISNKMDGIGWFTAETVKRIVKDHPEDDFYLFFDRKPESSFVSGNNVHPVILHPQARHPILWYLFFEWSVTKALKKYKIELFLSPDGFISTKSKVPTLTVIHDLNFEHFEGNLKASHQRFMSHYFPRYAQLATRIATVSEYSKKDIAETYHIASEKIDVVYDGAHDAYTPLGTAENTKTRDEYTQGKPYFIFISTILRRKNLANLLTAFDQFKTTSKSDMKLVVVGARVWWQDELKEAFDRMEHQDDVIFAGRADVETLSRLLSAAKALVYPSFFEGFGIPIIEAFHAEVPVITSNCTSMPEIAGDAALLIDPYDTNAIATALARIEDDAKLCNQLIERGSIQREKFTWDITARLLWESMMKCVEK